MQPQGPDHGLRGFQFSHPRNPRDPRNPRLRPPHFISSPDHGLHGFNFFRVAQSARGLLQQPQRLRVHPLLEREGPSPLRRRDVARFMPARLFDPIEKLAYAGTRCGRCALCQ